MPGRARVASQHRRELAGCEGRSGPAVLCLPVGCLQVPPGVDWGPRSDLRVARRPRRRRDGAQGPSSGPRPRPGAWGQPGLRPQNEPPPCLWELVAVPGGRSSLVVLLAM